MNDPRAHLKEAPYQGINTYYSKLITAFNDFGAATGCECFETTLP
jgi:hypothetical protein